MIVKISKTAKKILLNIDVQKYCKLTNDIYRLPDSKFMMTTEKEQEVRKFIKKYFPEVLENYNVFLVLKDYEPWRGPVYSLVLREKTKKLTTNK